jgi:hypothetical protein
MYVQSLTRLLFIVLGFFGSRTVTSTSTSTTSSWSSGSTTT